VRSIPDAGDPSFARRASASALTGGAALVLAALVSGCGGGVPLMHPAQTLARGDVRAEGGFSANIATAGLSSAISAAEADTTGSGGPPPNAASDPTFAKGAIAEAAVGPALAPFVGARVGVGEQFEGGLAWTGRAVRADIRRSFELGPHWALSLGAGGSAVLYGQQNEGALAQLHGWGADVPLLVGYESEGGLYTLWVGARGGWEHVNISDLTSEPKTVTLGITPAVLSATRWWGGGVLGFAVGFRHFHVALELDASYATINGSYNQTSVQVDGLTLSPAAALWWSF
jgi:hypothetical protein